MSRPRRAAAPWIAYHQHRRCGAWPTREAAQEALGDLPSLKTGFATVFHKDTKECWARQNGNWVRTDHRRPLETAPAAEPAPDPELEEIDPGGDGRAARWWLEKD